MKSKFLKIVATLMVAFTAASCTTTYDSYGYQRQSVDPLAAAAVAGVAGYAIGKNQNKPKYYYGGPRYGYYPRYAYGPRVNPYRAAAFRHRAWHRW